MCHHLESFTAFSSFTFSVSRFGSCSGTFAGMSGVSALVFTSVGIATIGVSRFFMGKPCEIISFIKSSSICGFPPLCFAISLQFYKVCDFGYQFFHVAALYQPFVRREQRRTEHGFTLCVQFLFEPFSVGDKYFHKG